MLITANLASIKARRRSLPRMLDSIRTQVDVVRVYCNDYTPDSALQEKFDNVDFYWGEDYTDRAKFMWVGEPELYCCCDDDILYPDDYVYRMMGFIRNNPRKIATFHGRKLLGKGIRYYQDHHLFHYRNIETDQKLLDVPGTGVTAFNTKYIQPSVIEKNENLMADLLLALEAAERGWPIVGLPHGKEFNILPTAQVKSIYMSQRANGERQDELADDIYRLRN